MTTPDPGELNAWMARFLEMPEGRDYVEDHEEMARVLSTLSDGERFLFTDELVELCSGMEMAEMQRECRPGWRELWPLIASTPEQKCRAMWLAFHHKTP